MSKLLWQNQKEPNLPQIFPSFLGYTKKTVKNLLTEKNGDSY